MVFRAREKASEFERENAYPVPIHYLTHKVANINQVFTQHAYMRLHACGKNNVSAVLILQ